MESGEGDQRRTIRGNWYEYPEYYDIAFGWDPGIEVDFVEDCFARFAEQPVRRIYEPFCGTGRIAIALAQRGYDVTGVELIPAVIDFARRRSAEADTDVRWEVGDARDWVAPQPMDAVVCLIDSFRHLPPDAARRATRRFADALRPGGLLILGVDVGDRPIEVTSEEHWVMERDGTTIETAVFDLRKPGRTPGTTIMRAQMAITDPDDAELEIICDDEMAVYSLSTLLELLRDAGGFTPLTICDRRYDLARPIRPDNYAGDIVAAFRRD